MLDLAAIDVTNVVFKPHKNSFKVVVKELVIWIPSRNHLNEQL